MNVIFLNATINHCLFVPYNKRATIVDNDERKLLANYTYIVCTQRVSFSIDTETDHGLFLYSIE